ncbi:phosphate ABC transporter permease PstA [Veronia pacifica]|uniref:Phosphate transport system permease protein PstA n=1 Tax=Veronia pacifica TaxID=1080227 RepID=A0A1C3EGE2_9GAMM|nr:phosphate ABC transporter permease PstA [Veronia pacifica]ODA32291.1 phosphate ABC transporter, permease protein PstA [Veronia pacifica]
MSNSRKITSPTWIWLSGGMISLCIFALLGVTLLIGWQGLQYFWPASVYKFDVRNNQGEVDTFYGQIYQQSSVPTRQLIESGIDVVAPDEASQKRYLIRIGDRGNEAHDFISVLEQDLVRMTASKDLAVIERVRGSVLYGKPVSFINDGQLHSRVFDNEELRVLLELTRRQVDKILDIEKRQIGRINYLLEKVRLEERSFEQQGETIPETLKQEKEELNQQYKTLESELIKARGLLAADDLNVKNRHGEMVAVPVSLIMDVWYPNAMSTTDKVVHWLAKVKQFIVGEPRDANSEGGVFPAIFGTVLMVLLMSVLVMPLGVMAAVYLHEYAEKNWLTTTIRIAITNLAGVPSIVYGVFGLGFFVYFVGDGIDQLFYSESLPAPTFGTPGILWSSLTLALLTLPVVIVSTEEGLARIPQTVRHGSLALGATKSETLFRIVLPMATPAMMTGLILAIARAAGEVAPLMLVGVVKSAPNLPLDANFPYLHLERKFMHLGYHIYDAGFQSPNTEAARPMVYATSFLLLTVVVGLNLLAVAVRNQLREKYMALEQDI